MLVEQRGELVGRCDPGGDVVVAQPHECLQLARGSVERLQRPQPVLVGAQQIGEPVGIPWVALGAGALPAWPGRVILLRHASAGHRDGWDSDDQLRPLDERGRAEALVLCDLLRARGVKRVFSSPYVRCTQTVAPLGLEIVPDERLAEGAYVEETLELLRDADDAVACTHGDVIEAVLGRSLQKGVGVVLDGSLREVGKLNPAP